MSSSNNIHRDKENELIISLLGRLAFPNDVLKKLVTHGAKKPEKMLKVYNLCDGETPVSEIAKKAGITQQAVSFAVDKWDTLGIILKRVRGKEVLPRKLYMIE